VVKLVWKGIADVLITNHVSSMNGPCLSSGPIFKKVIFMNITIFGASGKIGTILTNLALDKGETVTAYVRNPEKIKRVHDRLHIVIGDLKNQAQIEKAIESAEVVMSTLGPSLKRSENRKGTAIADGHELIIKAMEKLNKKRFITLATPSIHAKEDGKHLATVFPGIIARIFLSGAYRDIVKYGSLIQRSKLDWTVVRIINPNAKQNGKKYGISIGDRPAKISVSRENVAAFMYEVAIKHLYFGKMPIVFNL
jgi:putative NADH-flavin reductase